MSSVSNIDSLKSLKFWNDLAKSLPTGKTVGPKVYVHRSALSPETIDALNHLEQRSLDGEWNMARLPLRLPADSISLTWYPGFGVDPFPVLQRSVNIKIKTGASRVRNFHRNRPLLHRCEMMVAPSHPRRAEMARVTSVCEKAGLFRLPPSRIGFEDLWNRSLRVHDLDPFPTDEAA